MSKNKLVNKNTVIGLAVLCVVLIVALAGTVVYYQPMINNQVGEIRYLNSEIASLNNETANLKNQVTIFGNQIENLNKQISQLEIAESAYLVTALGATDISGNSTEANHLFITGTITNEGTGTAYSVGLHIVAYSTDAVLVINMTVPPYGVNSYQNGFISGTPLTITLSPTESTSVYINIFHEGTIGSTDYSITPVWTNTS